jgi:hypothetical protein
MSFGSIGSVAGMEVPADPNHKGRGEVETAWGFPLLHVPENSYLNSEENCATYTHSALGQNIGQANSSSKQSPVCGQRVRVG